MNKFDAHAVGALDKGDFEIAEKLARMMGWIIIPERTLGLREHWAEPCPDGSDCNHGPNEHYKESVRRWDPDTRWDHIGIVIDWMKKQNNKRVDSFFNSIRRICLYRYNDLTPHHIALAAIVALE